MHGEQNIKKVRIFYEALRVITHQQPQNNSVLRTIWQLEHNTVLLNQSSYCLHYLTKGSRITRVRGDCQALVGRRLLVRWAEIFRPPTPLSGDHYSSHWRSSNLHQSYRFNLTPVLTAPLLHPKPRKKSSDSQLLDNRPRSEAPC